MSAEELARLDAMADEEIEAPAWSDPDARPLIKDEGTPWYSPEFRGMCKTIENTKGKKSLVDAEHYLLSGHKQPSRVLEGHESPNR